jgi:heme exporter protein B
MKQYLSIFNIFRKDLLCHTRSAVTIISIPFFALLVMVVFAFAFGAVSDNAQSKESAASILWIALTFGSVIGLSQTFVAEKENSCLKGLLLCPMERHIIYLGKLLGSLVVGVTLGAN